MMREGKGGRNKKTKKEEAGDKTRSVGRSLPRVKLTAGSRKRMRFVVWLALAPVLVPWAWVGRAGSKSSGPSCSFLQVKLRFPWR